MSIFHVTTAQPRSTGGLIWLRFQTDCDSVESLYRKFSEDGVVYGDRLEVRRDEHGEMIAVGAVPVILGARMVAMVSRIDDADIHFAEGVVRK